MNQGTLSTRVTTHEIYFKEGNLLKHIRLTHNEAIKAIEAWTNKCPVPIPNLKDPELSTRFIAHFRVEEITRYRNI